MSRMPNAEQSAQAGAEGTDQMTCKTAGCDDRAEISGRCRPCAIVFGTTQQFDELPVDKRRRRNDDDRA